MATWLAWTLALAIAAFPAGLQAQDAARQIQQIESQFGELTKAGRLGDAEAIARRGLTLAEGAGNPNWTSDWLDNLGRLYTKQKRYREAEPLFQRMLAIEERLRGKEHLNVAVSLRRLGEVCEGQRRLPEAAAHYQRALAILEKQAGPEDPRLAMSLEDLALVYSDLKRYDEAEKLLRRSLAIREKALGADHLHTAAGSLNLARLYDRQGQFTKAEPLFSRAIAIYAAQLGPGHPQTEQCLNALSQLYEKALRYADAETLCKQALEISRKVHGQDHSRTAVCLNNLASVYAIQGRYEEAEKLCLEAVDVSRRANGPEHLSTAANINNLASLYGQMGRYADVEMLYRQALAIFRKTAGPEEAVTAIGLNNLAGVYEQVGRFADAEPLYKQALAIAETKTSPTYFLTATCLYNLASVLGQQGRDSEAGPLYQRALEIRLKVLGREHPDTIKSLQTLAITYEGLGRYPEAEKLYNEALSLERKVLGENHPEVGRSLRLLGLFHAARKRHAEADDYFRKALALEEKALGPNHPRVSSALINLAWSYAKQKRFQEALPLSERAVHIVSRPGTGPWDQYKAHYLRAQILWYLERRRESLPDLKQALDLAEQQRVQVGGAERERSEVFGRFSDAYETMVAWQTELGDVDAAWTAIERSRARSLLDEIALNGADLDIGRPEAERRELRRREAELNTRIASLQKQLAIAANRPEAERKQLESSLEAARDALYQHFRDRRSTSPIYRKLLSAGSGALRLDDIRNKVLDAQSVLLEYLFGEGGGYVMIVGANRLKLVALRVDEASARDLGVEPGPLNSNRLEAILVREDDEGVVQLVATGKTERANARLAILWHILVPAEVREELVSGRIKRLVVVPDGPLALLPLETLVVEQKPQARNLLDVGPPILYAPSATVLHNLSQRKPPANAAESEPILTVGNPAYGAAPQQANPATETRAASTTSRSRYVALGGPLSPLPYSAWESAWIAEAFDKQGIKTLKIEGAEATESNLRSRLPDRQLIHMACHGLADQAYGNFYGALALSPGRAASLDDDGFLTLAEVYQLPLAGCELAILSACHTNYGPQQQGEGVWAISRGFLVAGARRVVASNWVVDDEAAATLVSYFCTALAEQQGQGKTPDYIACLHQAKRSIRQQEKWRDPFYWATLVLVGPP